jgi:hypothetical protein
MRQSKRERKEERKGRGRRRPGDEPDEEYAYHSSDSHSEVVIVSIKTGMSLTATT